MTSHDFMYKLDVSILEWAVYLEINTLTITNSHYCLLIIFFPSLLVWFFVQSEVQSMSESQSAQRDDSPMDVDQPSPLEQDPAPLGMKPAHGNCLHLKF